MKFVNLVFIFFITFLGHYALSIDNDSSVGLLVGGQDNTSAVPSGLNIANPGQLKIKIHTSCYPTNLRAVANPISPDSIIKSNLSLKIADKDLNFFVSFPGTITAKAPLVLPANVNLAPVQKNGSYTVDIVNTKCEWVYVNNNIWGGYNYWGIMGGQKKQVCTTTTTQQKYNFENHNLPGSSSMAIFGNTIHINYDMSTLIKRKADGTPETSPGMPTINTYSFSQTVMGCGSSKPIYGTYGHSSHNPTYACGGYMATDGAPSATVSNFKVAKDNSTIEMSVAFPGQTGFCGGYWSPLMVFFDEKRPLFNGSSSFPLYPGVRTSWVEMNSSGYFLVYNDKLDGVIDRAEQVFGNSDQHENGFDKLKKFDTNRDGFISREDREFKKLYLWNDKNGDGVSQASEMWPASKKLYRISLNYKKGHIRPIGKNAEERERSFFEYKVNNKILKSDIVDIWLAPSDDPQLASQ